jgi:DNA helicase-2/ATP-dependent DNA helicase PcrA
MTTVNDVLLDRLTEKQKSAVASPKRRLLVVAGAGSGKTEVMARRVAWWVAVEKIPKDSIVAFTFTERAAEEMKFRIRHWLGKIASAGEEVSLGGMYVGTIHGFCAAKLREYWPDDYHNCDILAEGARAALILRGFNHLLALGNLQQQKQEGQYVTLERFTQAYDLLHEHNRFDVQLPAGDPPCEPGEEECRWCEGGELRTNVGDTPEARAFAVSAARYYAYLRCRRFLDFSTSQSELIRWLRADGDRLERLARRKIHLVVDEVQDINPVQRELIKLLVGDSGRLTAVGDHRQSIYGFRGAKVEIIAELWEEFKSASDADVVDLEENFRSTPMIINLANRWADTIGAVRSMKTAPMKHGNIHRTVHDKSHVALVSFKDRDKEAAWIADTIQKLVKKEHGALHDKTDGSPRGLTLSDVAVMVRSSTDVRTYMRELENAGIPCVVRAGPDLFLQPEVLLFAAALVLTTTRYDNFTFPYKITQSIAYDPESVPESSSQAEIIFRSAAAALREKGLTFKREVESRLLRAAEAVRDRIAGKPIRNPSIFRTPRLRDFLSARNRLRRVFPQQIFHMLLAEAEVYAWDTCAGRGQTALFHLGALSGLIKGMETPGWTSVRDYPWQITGLCRFGSEEGRTAEQPLMAQPDAVSILTIHAAKGLEFAAVFLADVNAGRFPNSLARRKPELPLHGEIMKQIDIDGLADNDNYDGERRLLYVAMTRAERFLFISRSGKKKSKFIKELCDLMPKVGALVTDKPKHLLEKLPQTLKYAPKEPRRDTRIVTSFSDLRYYWECPHDFYLRKVLGFSPTIDQAFGYGRGVHNLMRAVHSNPKKWAVLARDEKTLEREINALVRGGLFYLRYTTGEPARKMREKAIRLVMNYIRCYAVELDRLTFEPEKGFESLIEHEDGGGTLVSGTIDLLRQDNPPRVTIIDFKSGDPNSDLHQTLAKKEMQFQIGLYALAAKKELEYQPDQGLVRYLDADDPTKAELKIPLDGESLEEVKKKIEETSKRVRDRHYAVGPESAPRNPHNKVRCAECDFCDFCGMPSAREYRRSRERVIEKRANKHA